MFSFSFFRAKPFLIRRLVLQIHSYAYVLRVCDVCYAEGRDIPTLSRMRFSTEQTPFIERYFFSSKISFSVMTISARTISFLCLLHEASTVLRKSILVPLDQLVSFQEKVSHTATVTVATEYYPLCHTVVWCWFWIRGLRFIPRIGPIVVLCHSSSDLFLVTLLLPLLFLLRSRAVDFKWKTWISYNSWKHLDTQTDNEMKWNKKTQQNFVCLCDCVCAHARVDTRLCSYVRQKTHIPFVYVCETENTYPIYVTENTYPI
jgi:hypothetical protein